MGRQINLSTSQHYLKLNNICRKLFTAIMSDATHAQTMVQIFDHYQVLEYLNIWRKQSGLIFARVHNFAKGFKSFCPFVFMEQMGFNWVEFS